MKKLKMIMAPVVGLCVWCAMQNPGVVTDVKAAVSAFIQGVNSEDGAQVMEARRNKKDHKKKDQAKSTSRNKKAAPTPKKDDNDDDEEENKHKQRERLKQAAEDVLDKVIGPSDQALVRVQKEVSSYVGDLSPLQPCRYDATYVPMCIYNIVTAIWGGIYNVVPRSPAIGVSSAAASANMMADEEGAPGQATLVGAAVAVAVAPAKTVLKRSVSHCLTDPMIVSGPEDVVLRSAASRRASAPVMATVLEDAAAPGLDAETARIIAEMEECAKEVNGMLEGTGIAVTNAIRTVESDGNICYRCYVEDLNAINAQEVNNGCNFKKKRIGNILCEFYPEDALSVCYDWYKSNTDPSWNPDYTNTDHLVFVEWCQFKCAYFSKLQLYATTHPAKSEKKPLTSKHTNGTATNSANHRQASVPEAACPDNPDVKSGYAFNSTDSTRTPSPASGANSDADSANSKDPKPEPATADLRTKLAETETELNTTKAKLASTTTKLAATEFELTSTKAELQKCKSGSCVPGADGCCRACGSKMTR